MHINCELVCLFLYNMLVSIINDYIYTRLVIICLKDLEASLMSDVQTL